MADLLWWPTVRRGFATGSLGYLFFFSTARIVGPRLFRSCAKLSEGERGEWSSCVVSSVHATVMVCAVRSSHLSEEVSVSAGRVGCSQK